MSAREDAATIAKALPWYPYKGVDRFYDVGTLLTDPVATELVVKKMAELASQFQPDVLGVLDARGFLFGGMMAARMHIPIALVRKLGKMPNAVSSGRYDTEYGHRDGVCMQRHAIKPGQQMVLVDDLVATGGTAAAAMECAELMGINVVGFVSIVELDDFAEQRVAVLGRYAFVPRVAVITESELLSGGSVAAPLPDNYGDDGAAFESQGAMQKV